MIAHPDLPALRRRRRLLLALLAVVLMVMAASFINFENDIWWQMKSGADVVLRRTFHTTDVYSWTAAGKTWTQHEWLVEVAFFLVYRAFSWPGLVVLKIFVVLATFLPLLGYLNRVKANLYLSTFILLVAAMVNTRGGWSVFPSLFEYAFVVWTFLLLEHHRTRGARWVPWVLPPLALLWANTHGSFFLLDAMIAAYLAGAWLEGKLRARWSSYAPLAGPRPGRSATVALSVALAVSLLAPAVSPNGWGLYPYPFRIATGGFAKAYVNEYQSFKIYMHLRYPLAAPGIGLLAGTATLLFLARRRVNGSDLLLFLGFGYLAVAAYRHLAIAALVCLPLIVKYLGVWVREYEGAFRRSLLKDALLAFVLLSFLLYYKTVESPFSFGYSASGYPAGASRFIEQERPAGPLFNHYNYGGYLIGNLPDYPVFIDGRLEMYLDSDFSNGYQEIAEGGPQWSDLLDRYGVNLLLLSDQMPLTPLALGSPQWKLVYWDTNYLVIVRDIPANASIIARFHDRAAREYQRVSFYSASPDAIRYERLGLRALHQGQLNIAEENLGRSLIADSSYVRARYELGLVYVAMGQRRDARLQFERALSTSPGYQPARNALALL